jgi:hypothetical protein
MSIVNGDFVVTPFDRLVAPSMWTAVSEPVAATQATVTKAAGASGVKHVCYGIIATVACGATAQTPLNVELLDGASVVLAASIAAPVNGVGVVQLSGLHIPGTAATSMTLRISAAGVAASVSAVTLIGYDVD